MEFSVNELYGYYTRNLGIKSILKTKEKIKAMLISTTLAISFILLILSLIYTNKRIEYIFGGVAIYIFDLYFIVKLKNGLFTRIQKDNHIKAKGIEIIKTYRRKKLIKYIDVEYGIKTYSQKVLLIEILKEEASKHKVDKLWSIGILFTLVLPFWNNFIRDIEYTKDNMILVLMLITYVVMILTMFKSTVGRELLLLLNLKSRRYEEIICLIRKDLIYNEDKPRTFNGTLTLKKK
ncbi:hypothetical protein [Hathewaya massiliensis]|uniref:hypothetical protein n=1 Tax=Hathewaya massiliensis TaxID=1964382 RepID=UPI001159CC2B|nr:hypothetical protein [Hathewaya massiliensis]